MSRWRLRAYLTISVSGASTIWSGPTASTSAIAASGGSMDDIRWAVAMTQPGRERWAAENVRRQRREYYLPQCLGRRNGEEMAKPLFPGYLFARIDDRWHWLTGTLGVARVLMTGNVPAVLAEAVVAELKGREGPDGL